MGEDTYRRPSWDEYFLGLMDEVGKRATCDRGRSGCIVVRDKQIVCTGYVGSPPGFPHCDEVGTFDEEGRGGGWHVPDALCEDHSCGAECDLSGRQTRDFAQRKHLVLQDGTLPRLRDADHQCGHH